VGGAAHAPVISNPTSVPTNAGISSQDHRSGVGIFSSSCTVAPSMAYECGAEERTANHVVPEFARHQPANGAYALAVVHDVTIKSIFRSVSSFCYCNILQKTTPMICLELNRD